MVAGFQPGENQNPLPRAAGRFDHHPPLAAPRPGSRSTSALVEPAVGAARDAPVARTPPTPASARRSTTPSTGTSTRYAADAATVSSEASITTTHQTWSKMDPGGLNPDETQLLCRTRKKKSRCGPSTNSRGVIQCFFLLAAPFHCSAPVFHPGSPSTIVSTPYIYRDELPILITHFWL